MWASSPYDFALLKHTASFSQDFVKECGLQMRSKSCFPEHRGVVGAAPYDVTWERQVTIGAPFSTMWLRTIPSNSKKAYRFPDTPFIFC